MGTDKPVEYDRGGYTGIIKPFVCTGTTEVSERVFTEQQWREFLDGS